MDHKISFIFPLRHGRPSSQKLNYDGWEDNKGYVVVVGEVRKRSSNKEFGIFRYFIDRNIRMLIGIHILASIGSWLFYLTPPLLPRSILVHAVAQLVEALLYKPEGRGFVSRWCHSNVSLTLWPWCRLSLWQKWVPEIFRGGKGGRCVGLTTLPLSFADCFEIWDPQSPGTLMACPGQ